IQSAKSILTAALGGEGWNLPPGIVEGALGRGAVPELRREEKHPRISEGRLSLAQAGRLGSGVVKWSPEFPPAQPYGPAGGGIQAREA
ncbi:MAG: hypothetical protein OEW39_10620, partial [Deltaproteobacteria bacterium]|nr:hypothetical protein [Deltaproteobacteria bacterium]